MAVILISRGSYGRGKEVAEQVAKRLGYECISRESLLETSESFNIPSVKLIHAIEDVPSILDRFKYSNESYISYIQAALLKHLRKDNIVYHGFAAQFLVKDVSHVLKVRITSSLEDRVATVMERDKVDEGEAKSFLEKIDGQRQKWCQQLYGLDPVYADHYDLVVRLKKIPIDTAVDMVCTIATSETLRTTPESLQALEDLAVAADVRVALLDVKRNLGVTARNGSVRIRTEASISKEPDLEDMLERLAMRVSGVKDVNVQVVFRENPL
jgi:cytidylate kinase